MSEYLEIVAGTAYQHVIATPASDVFAVGEGASERAQIESRSGGRLGVFARDAGSGRIIAS